MNKRSIGQSDRITVALECFFRKAFPGSSFSKILESMILMLQPPHDNLSSNAVIFASILPEELRPYLEYTTHPIDEVIKVYMCISNKVIFNFFESIM